MDAETKFIAMLGHPIAQARTPKSFNSEFSRLGINLALLPMDALPAALPFLMEGLRMTGNCVGLSVTMPHKRAAALLCGRLTSSAARIGAVNIIRRDRDGLLCGEMTDGIACVAALRRKGFKANGAQCVLIGAGGAGSAIAFALAEAGARRLAVIDLDPGRRDDLLRHLLKSHPALAASDEVGDVGSVDLVVNATPLGMRPADPLPFELKGFPSGTFVCDIVTRPETTRFLEEARALNLKAVTGIEMADGQFEFQLGFLGLL